MNYLLDTHTFVWFIEGDNKLSQKAKNKIQESNTKKFVSIASFWEMAIKISLGKLKINQPFKEIYRLLDENGFDILPIGFEHTLLVSNLEFHHRDPFDRLIIVQAIKDDMTIITKDENFQHYDVEIFW